MLLVHHYLEKAIVDNTQQLAGQWATCLRNGIFKDFSCISNPHGVPSLSVCTSWDFCFRAAASRLHPPRRTPTNCCSWHPHSHDHYSLRSRRPSTHLHPPLLPQVHVCLMSSSTPACPLHSSRLQNLGPPMWPGASYPKDAQDSEISICSVHPCPTHPSHAYLTGGSR